MSIRVQLYPCHSLCRTTSQRISRALLSGDDLPTALTGPGTPTVNLLQASRHPDSVHLFQGHTRFLMPVGRGTDLHPDQGLPPLLTLKRPCNVTH